MLQFSEIRISNKKTLKKAWSNFTKKKDSYSKGRMRGLLFESYAIYFLIKLLKEKKIDWLLHPAEVYGTKRESNNCLAYTESGQLVLKQGKYPVSEYDALFGFGDKTFICEMKSSGINKPHIKRKILSRSLKFESIFRIPTFNILIVPNTVKSSNNLADGIIQLDRFWQFEEEFLNNPSFYFNSPLVEKIKSKSPEIFHSTEIDFTLNQQIAQSIFCVLKSPSLDPLPDNWRKPFHIIHKFPVGKITINSLPKSSIPSTSKLREKMKNSTTLLYLTEEYPSIIPMLVVMKNPTYSKYKTYYVIKMKDYERFTSGSRSMGVESFHYQYSKKYSELNPPTITASLFQTILKRCKQLSSPKIENVDFSEEEKEEMYQLSMNNFRIFTVLF